VHRADKENKAKDFQVFLRNSDLAPIKIRTTL